MMNPLSISLALLALSLVSGVVAAWEKLFAPDPKRRALGVAALIILVTTLVVQGSLEVYKSLSVESLETFLDTQEKDIEEASGATFWNDKIIVVDDESPSVYEYKYDEALGKAKQEKRYQILADPTLQSSIRPETIAEIDDLEAAAAYNEKLYVVSSHSLNKKDDFVEARELILEIDRLVTLPGEPPEEEEERVRCPEALGNALAGGSMACVTRAATLTAAVKEALEKASTRPIGEGEINIEGLAIDDDGNVYIGLRSPLIEEDDQRFAVLLQTTVESVFSKSPEVKVVKLRLEKGNDSYGITSLEYDGKDLLILGNGPDKRDHFQPRIWRWHPNGRDSDQPPMADWSLRMPESFDAKPEALAFSRNSGPAFVFIDAPGHGGQRVIPRKALGLPEQADPRKLAENRP